MGSNASKPSVGPFEEFNMNEIQAIEDENELKRAKQLLIIRQRNLRQKSVVNRRKQSRGRSTIRMSIFEDVALEDLCEAAGIECDQVERTGRVKAKCKEETLKRLTKHHATKEVFESKQSFKTFLDSRVNGAESETVGGGGNMLLNPNFNLEITKSNFSITRSNISLRSQLSISKSDIKMRSKELSHEEELKQRARTINNPLKPWAEYSVDDDHTGSRRRESKLMDPAILKPLSEEFYTPTRGRTSIGPMMQSTISITRTDADNKRHSIQRGRNSYLGPAGRKSVLTNTTTGRTSVIADRSRRQSIAIGAIKDRRTSKKRKTVVEEPKTIYSLDTDFKNTLYTTISPENRKKVSIACRLNEETLMMAESLAKKEQKGKKKNKICPFF